MFKEHWKLLVKKIEIAMKCPLKCEDISNSLYELLIVAEDHRFWLHCGIDLVAICRAVWRTKFCGRREGGSTIAMQLVRVFSGNYEMSLNRKVIEICLAIKLTKKLKRQEILKLYLSVAYFGWNMHGIRQTCSYIGLKLSNLTLCEAASIIARLKYPEPRYYSASKQFQIKTRINYILHRYEKLTRC